MLEKAVRVCDAKFGLMYRYDGNSFEPAAWIGIPPALLISYINAARFNRRQELASILCSAPGRWFAQPTT